MEKVKVPAWVADYIKNDLINAVDINKEVQKCLIYSNESCLTNFEKWIIANPAEYVLAMKCGYEIEQPTKYYIKILPHENGYLNVKKQSPNSKEKWFISNNAEAEETKTQFTIDEIEELSPRFKPFAVEVEDND